MAEYAYLLPSLVHKKSLSFIGPQLKLTALVVIKRLEIQLLGRKSSRFSNFHNLIFFHWLWYSVPVHSATGNDHLYEFFIQNPEPSDTFN